MLHLVRYEAWRGYGAVTGLVTIWAWFVRHWYYPERRREKCFLGDQTANLKCTAGKSRACWNVCTCLSFSPPLCPLPNLSLHIVFQFVLLLLKNGTYSMSSLYNSAQVRLISKHLQKEGTGTVWILYAELFPLPTFPQPEKLFLSFILLLFLFLTSHHCIILV